LQGLEVSVIPLSAVNLRDRSDAEYFSKENRAIEASLRDHDASPLREFGTLVGSAFYPAATDLYEVGDVPFARCVDCIGHPVISRQQDAKFVRVPSWFVEQSKQIECAHSGDIIITKVGTPCFASIVRDYDRIALSRTVLGLVRVHDIDPYYLTAFLRCRFGFNQLLRQREQTIQFQLTLERVRDVLVYRGSPELQSEVAKRMHAYTDALNSSSSELVKAEAVITESIGLAQWKSTEQRTYSARASEAFASNRIDAEYYHPDKKSILKYLKARPGRPLSEHYAAIREMFDPVKQKQQEVVRNFDLNDALQPVLDDEWPTMPTSEVGSTKKRLAGGDVVISRLRAYLREIALVRTSGSTLAVGSSEFVVLRPINPKNPKLSRAALLFFLRSQPVQTILRWSQDGSHHPRFGEEDLLSIPVPDAVCMVAKKVEENFEKILTTRAQARAFLIQAKRGVEIAIEDSEAAALKYLKES
jgi:hypothetical protein